MAEKIGLSALLLGPPKPKKESEVAAQRDPKSNDNSREDLISVFADIENKELSGQERMEALKLFVELAGRDKNPFA